MDRINIEDVYEYSPNERLPQICFQRLESLEQTLPLEKYKYILSKLGVLVISLDYEEKTSYTLERVISQLGRPHTHSTQNDIAWHIKSGGLKNNEKLARSHQLSEFVLHTDCSYEEHIPDFFGLYCVRPDRCGGGKNLLVDCATLIQHLTDESYHTLTTENVEIIVPPEFKRGVDLIRAKVIDENFNVRYRREIIKDDSLTPQLKSALDEFERLCNSPVLNRRFELKERQILLLDNKRYLHARTSIKDPERHLIRIRFFTEFDKLLAQ